MGKLRKGDNAQRLLSQLQPWTSKHTCALLSNVRRGGEYQDSSKGMQRENMQKADVNETLSV
jgi:hypothetical protein